MTITEQLLICYWANPWYYQSWQSQCNDLNIKQYMKYFAPARKYGNRQLGFENSLINKSKLYFLSSNKNLKIHFPPKHLNTSSPFQPSIFLGILPPIYIQPSLTTLLYPPPLSSHNPGDPPHQISTSTLDLLPNPPKMQPTPPFPPQQVQYHRHKKLRKRSPKPGLRSAKSPPNQSKMIFLCLAEQARPSHHS